MGLGHATNWSIAMSHLLLGTRTWSSRKLSERVAILAIGFIVVCAGAVGLVAAVVQVGSTVPPDHIAEQQRTNLQESIDRELHVGDPSEQIQAFLARHGLAYEYESVDRRYVARAYRSANGAHDVMVTLWADSNGRYVRGQATDILTSL